MLGFHTRIRGVPVTVCLSSSLVRIVEDLEEKSILFQEAALLNTLLK